MQISRIFSSAECQDPGRQIVSELMIMLWSEVLMGRTTSTAQHNARVTREPLSQEIRVCHAPVICCKEFLMVGEETFGGSVRDSEGSKATFL